MFQGRRNRGVCGEVAVGVCGDILEDSWWGRPVMIRSSRPALILGRVDTAGGRVMPSVATCSTRSLRKVGKWEGRKGTRERLVRDSEGEKGRGEKESK